MSAIENSFCIDTYCACLFVCPRSNSSEIVCWNSWQLGLSFCFDSVNQQFISSRFVQKVIVSGRSSLSTYSFLSEPSRQPLLNHGSPLWQRARTAAFTLTSNQINVWSIMCLLPSGQLWICKNNPLWYPLTAYVLEWCVCLCDCVCAQSNRIKEGPCPPRELSIWFYMLSDKIRTLWYICIYKYIFILPDVRTGCTRNKSVLNILCISGLQRNKCPEFCCFYFVAEH